MIIICKPWLPQKSDHRLKNSTQHRLVLLDWPQLRKPSTAGTGPWCCTNYSILDSNSKKIRKQWTKSGTICLLQSHFIERTFSHSKELPVWWRPCTKNSNKRSFSIVLSLTLSVSFFCVPWINSFNNNILSRTSSTPLSPPLSLSLSLSLHQIIFTL